MNKLPSIFLVIFLFACNSKNETQNLILGCWDLDSIWIAYDSTFKIYPDTIIYNDNDTVISNYKHLYSSDRAYIFRKETHNSGNPKLDSIYNYLDNSYPGFNYSFSNDSIYYFRARVSDTGKVEFNQSKYPVMKFLVKQVNQSNMVLEDNFGEYTFHRLETCNHIRTQKEIVHAIDSIRNIP